MQKIRREQFDLIILIQSLVFTMANKKWMLVINPALGKRFEENIKFGSEFSFTVRYWEEPIGSGCW